MADETTMTLTHAQANQLIDCLGGVTKMLTYRDRMNAAVHCSDVRWSPLTDQVHDTLHMLVDAIKENMKLTEQEFDDLIAEMKAREE